MKRLRPPRSASSCLLALAAPAAAQDGVQTLKFQYGPVKITPGQNTIELEPNDAQAAGRRLDTSLQARPRVRRTAASRASTSSTCTTASGSRTASRCSPPARRRPRSPLRRATAGATTRTTAGHEPHDPQPHADAGRGLHHLRARLHPGRRAGGARGSTRSRRSGSTSSAAPTRCSTRKRGTRRRDGRFTYPDEAPGARRRNALDGARGRRARRHRRPPAPGRAVDRPEAHARRAHRRALFRSEAKYYEPAGAVSWDVSMTVTPPDWRVQLRKGDVLSVSGTYDTRGRPGTSRWGSCRRCWTPGGHAAPTRSRPTSTSTGQVTHGHLPENNNHGGGALAGSRPARAARAARRAAAARSRSAASSTARATSAPTGRARPPAGVRAGRALTFVNRDAGERRSSTRSPPARRPATATTGIAYPLADGPVDFDSGELGFGPRGFTAAANRDTWTTPKDLDARHLHVLLPRAPVHARRVPREGEGKACAEPRRSQGRSELRRDDAGGCTSA